MTAKEFKFGQEARDKVLAGVNTLANAVRVTLGPRGKTVMIKQSFGMPTVTKDGVTVAKQVTLEDPFEDAAAQTIKQVAQKTNDVAGDGTTTATVLAQSIIQEGLKLVSAGYNPSDLKNGIEFAVDHIVKELENVSKKVTDQKEITQVGTISANGDSEIGNMIADAMDKVGNEGVISLEEGKGINTTLDVVTGYQFDRGWLSQHFTTNEKLESVLENPVVLLFDKNLSNAQVVISILESCHQKMPGRPILIIAEDVGGDALPTLVINHMRKTVQSCCVKAPGFGDRRKEMLEDIATLTGATVVSEDTGLKIENFSTDWLGSAKRAIVKKGNCTIIEGAGTTEDIEMRVEEIRMSAENADNDYDREKQEERLAKLVGGVAMISVGAATESEMKEKKDRVEDALNATKAAVQEGIVAGGGVALFRAALSLDNADVPDGCVEGVKIVRKAVEEPLRRIVLNMCGDPTLVRLRILENDNVNFGFNARTEVFEDLMESGVIDPTKVVRCALQNAASVAGMVLITECMMAEVVKNEQAKPQGMPVM